MAETAKNPKEEEQSLENFDWDTTGSGDFFGIEGTGAEPPTPPVEEEEIEKPNPTPEGEEEEEEEIEQEKEKETFFEENEEEEEEEEQLNDSHFNSLATQFKEKGIFQNIELPEDEEITEDRFIELQDEEIEARVDEALEGFLEELDDDGAAFLKFKKEGGSTEDFFKTYGKTTARPTGGDLEEESYQEKVSRYYFKEVENLDEEDINDKIEWLKDGGKLAKYAEKYDSKLGEIDKKQKEDLQKAAKEQEKLQEEARKAFVNTVKETLDKTNEIDNFKFPEKEKKALHAFITKPTIKVAKNRYITGMQSKLQTALKDPEKMLILAKLLNSDFDVSDVVATTTTKTTKKIKKDLQRASTVRPASSGKANKRRSLADIDF